MKVAVINKTTKAVAGVFDCETVYERTVFSRHKDKHSIDFYVLSLVTGEEYDFPKKVFNVVVAEN